MTRRDLLLTVVCALPAAALSQDKVNAGARVLDDFQKHVAEYVALHKAARTPPKRLKPTVSPQEISHYEHLLAHNIRESRKGAVQGAIFTPEVAAEFRRLVQIALQGSSGTRVQQSMNHAEPVHVPRLVVNGAYPENLPLQSTPPSFLLNLPKLPPEVEYRVVGHDLVLRDRDANLVVDLIPNLVP